MTVDNQNNYAEGVSYQFNVLNEGGDSPFQMLRCHNVCMLGTRGQSLVDISDGSSLNSFDETVRDKLIEEQYSEISANKNGSFIFDTEGTVGESILTIGKAHTAVYFGTDKNGTQYFLNKASTGDYTINSYSETMKTWGGDPNNQVKAYTIKKQYKGAKLIDGDVDKQFFI